MANVPILGDIFGDLVDSVKDVVSEVVVDVDAKREMQFRLEELKDKAAAREVELSKAQIEVNKAEAGHASIFVAGWRPAVGWISAAGVAYTFVLMPLMAFISRVVFGYDGDFPILETEQLMLLLAGMLGIAGFRSFEINRGVNRDSLTAPRQGGVIPEGQTASSPMTAANVDKHYNAVETPPGFGEPAVNTTLPENAPWSR